MKTVDTDIIGKNYNDGKNAGVDNRELILVNKQIRNHQIEAVGDVLRQAMTDMKAISTVA